MARDPRRKLLILILLGLSPLLGSDLIYGQNDSFVLAWVVFSLWLWYAANRSERRRTVFVALSAVAFGLACVSKPTAWFIAPFYALLIAGGEVADLWRRPSAWLRRAVTAGWPSLLVMALVIGPYLLWNAGAMFDDVWRWSAGTSDTAYQIWGWGASNLLLAFGAVQSRFAYWPFWLPELLIGVPLLIGLVKKQTGDNTPARVLWGSSLLLLTYAFVSRFLNENYLSYILACIALAALIETPEGAPFGSPKGASSAYSGG